MHDFETGRKRWVPEGIVPAIGDRCEKDHELVISAMNNARRSYASERKLKKLEQSTKSDDKTFDDTIATRIGDLRSADNVAMNKTGPDQKSCTDLCVSTKSSDAYSWRRGRFKQRDLTRSVKLRVAFPERGSQSMLLAAHRHNCHPTTVSRTRDECANAVMELRDQSVCALHDARPHIMVALISTTSITY